MKKLKNGANLITDNLPKLRAILRELTAKEVLVGIPSSRGEREDEDGELNNAAIGYIMEHGAPEANIPARPWLAAGLETVKGEVSKQFELAAKRAVNGVEGAAEQGLERAGLVAQNGVRAYLNAGVDPALKPPTLESRRRRGRTGTKPLIDTGQLRNSVTYVVKDK